MSQDIYEKARELIKTRKLEEARRVLLPIANEPKAKAWLDKIDEISPQITKSQDKPFYTPPATATKVQSVPKSRLGLGILLGLLLGALGGLGAGFFAFGSEEPDAEKIVIVTASPLPSTPTPVATDTLTPDPCSIQEWWSNADPLVTEFLDTGEVAGSTGRGNLSPIVLELQRIKRDYENLEYPDCASDIYLEIWSGLTSAIDGFNSFMLQDDFETRFNFGWANQRFTDATYMLLEYSLASDFRMVTTFSIWGGDIPEGTSTPTPLVSFTPTVALETTHIPIDGQDRVCSIQIGFWWSDARSIADNFLTAAMVASQFSDDEQVQNTIDLMNIYREQLQEVRHVDECAIAAHGYFDIGINKAIEGYQTSLDSGEEAAKALFNEATEQFYLLYTLLNNVSGPPLFPNPQMADTSQIWGGDAPSDGEPTGTPDPESTPMSIDPFGGD